jgi:sugar/nucleoside kinase (ribokinase family)
MEEDGRRTQVWRVPENVIGAQLCRNLGKLPLNYQQARGLHFGVHPDAFHQSGDVEFIQCLRQQGAVVSIECFKPAEQAPQPDALRRLVSSAEIFSANQEEAQSLVGEGDPFEQARSLAKAGGNEPVTQAIVVRLGAAGSVVMHVATGESLLIPAFPTQVVDPIGAGNAYCGGFLSGWVYKKDLRLAAIWGAVSASFMVEQIGLPKLSPEILLESRRREALLHKLGEEKK